MTMCKTRTCIPYWVICLIRTVLVLQVYIHMCLSQNVIRRTRLGILEGIVRKPFANTHVECFLGVPYALPPVGPLRFEAPEPYPAWSRARRAVEFSASCLQYRNNTRYLAHHRSRFGITDEDCLYLNIYVPQVVLFGYLPVLLFVHGGSNSAGSGAIVEGEYLASHGNIVVVTFNYRLGAFGFLGTGKPEFPGNYGLLDQNLAMRWVKDNIASFNGDPESVTVMGHSAGAIDVGLHMVSPLSTGLFRYVILQSGSPLSSFATKDQARAENEIWNITKEVQCDEKVDLSAVKECLKTLPAKDLNKKFSIYSSYQFRALIDGIFLPDSPQNLFLSGHVNGQRVLTGITKDEAFFFARSGVSWLYANLISDMKGFSMIPEDMDLSEDILFEYGAWRTSYQYQVDHDVKTQAFGDALMDIPAINVANALVKRHIPVYFYRFNYKPLAVTGWSGVEHGADLFFVFGSTFTNISSHATYPSEDRDVSLFVMSHWADFVKQGSPIPSASQKDILYQHRHPVFLLVQSGPQGAEFLRDKTIYKERKVEFWNNYLPQLIARFRKLSQSTCVVPTKPGLPESTTVYSNHGTPYSQSCSYQVFTLLIVLQSFYTLCFVDFEV